MTVIEAIRLVAKSDFRPFDKHDWNSFSGCVSENPMIHYADEADEEYTIILDGTDIVLINEEGDEYTFTVSSKSCYPSLTY